MRRALLVAAALALGAAQARGFDLVLDTRALSEAIDIGQSRIAAVRTRFHQPYRIQITRAPVDFVDVVTPFRRVVLAAESRAREGSRLFGQREAIATLGASPEQVDLLVELTFHPQNTYVGVPDYDVRLLPATPTTAVVEPRDIQRVPRFGPRLDGTPLSYPYVLSPPVAPGSLPLSGGTLVVTLDGRALSVRGVYDLLVSEEGKELASAQVEFGTLR